MKTELWLIGKTSFPYLVEGMALYEKRLSHYLHFMIAVLPDVKNAGTLPPEQLKVKEGELILSKIKSDDFLVLLDERGGQLTSIDFSKFIEQKLQLSHKRLVFVVGGAFGFSQAVYWRSDFQMALSKMTFSHQMIRLFFLEQLYRAMTILRGEGYHNE
jgi:23S rRNA (pseudouridine1915-N3)-methyltransferase